MLCSLIINCKTFVINYVHFKVKSTYEPSGSSGRTFFGFLSIKRLGVLLLPTGRDASVLQGYQSTPSIKFAGTHLYTWGKRGTVRVKCLAQEHNAVPQPRLEPRPLDPESNALTIRPLRLPQSYILL